MSTQAEQNFQAFGNAGARPIWYHGKCARLSVEGLLKVRPAPHLPCALGRPQNMFSSLVRVPVFLGLNASLNASSACIAGRWRSEVLVAHPP